MTGRTPDIFLSYSRQDLAIAGKMAAALQAAGHDVWWDQALKAGEVYDKVTETALLEARVVIVMWSKTSVASDWVRSEATVALQRGALVPVMIEDCRRPVMFELRQSADLTGWTGAAKDPRLTAFMADVTRQLGAPTRVAAPAVPPAAPASGPDRRLLIGGAVAALAAGGFGAWKFLGHKADDGTASVVVLPFANLSGDSAQAFFSDGIAEELRNALSQIKGLKVIARVSSEQFRDTKDLSTAAAKLGVDHILTGSVRRSPSTLRIGAQLVDGATGVESWSQSYDQPVGDALAVQSRIASSVVAALSSRLGKAVGVVAVGGTSNPQAQELFLKARELGTTGEQTEANFRQRFAWIDAAIALDPRYADAIATRSNLLTTLRRLYTSSPLEQAGLFREAMAEARRAVAVAPESGYARAVLSDTLRRRLEIREALAEAERGLAMAPGDWRVANQYAVMIGLIDPARGVDLSRANVALDPLNPSILGSLSFALNTARRFKEALEIFRQTKTLRENIGGERTAIRAMIELGRYDEARNLIPKLQIEYQKPVATAILEARAGNRAASDKALQDLRKIDDGTLHFQFAEVHAARGEIASALDSIEAAYKTLDPGISFMAVDQLFDPLRKEPRFKAVQDKVIPPDLFVPLKRG